MTLPDQPLEYDENIVRRFVPNALVRHLLDEGGLDMNDLAVVEATDEERTQFAQLIGYSVSGYSELSYVSDEAWSRVSTEAEDAQEEAAS